MTVDLAVIELARSGEPIAIARLLELSQSELRRYALRSCMISDVDDAVQEAMLVATRFIRALRYPRAWSRWMFRITRRACHRLARTALRRDIWDDDVVDAYFSIKRDDEVRLDVAAAIESLPDHYREVVVLRDLDGLTIGELSRQLSITRTAVKGRLHRARALIREFLIE
ncbi:MAG TPA: sigma-70 family RNA polymerase sigma factor [Kofleriaceae bacterium]